MPDRPEQSASAVTALGTTARSGMPARGRRAPAPASLGDALDQLGDAGPGDDRLAGDGALAEQDLRRGAGGQIDVDPAAEADQADALAGATRSPALIQGTIRRATRPAIWVKATLVPSSPSTRICWRSLSSLALSRSALRNLPAI